MVDLDALYRKLEHASFTQREQIAGEVVRDSAPEEIVPLVRGLAHPIEPVRLGIIEILRRASCREALRKLVEHANTHEGNERVFTVRAISYLAQPTDDFLLPHVKKWLALEDQFLEPHARKISSLLRGTPPSGIPALDASGVPAAPLPTSGSGRSGVIRPARTTPLGGVPIISVTDRPSSPVPTYGR